MFIIKHKKIFIIISSVLVVLAIVLLSVLKLDFGIDFKGGSQTEVVYEGIRPEAGEISKAVEALDIGGRVQLSGDNGLIIKTRELTDEEHLKLKEAISLEDKYKFEEKSFSSIGPSVGKELKRKSLVAMILVCLAIVLFIAYAFRKVSKPVSSWKYGLIAIATLLHDVAIPTGVFAILSHFRGFEVDTLFIVAILTILGLSVSDTIVVFDRIRENLRTNEEKKIKEEFELVVGKSIEQTFTRSINTSLTVIFVLLALVFFGPDSTKYFSIMLAAGMFFGTYSSIFLASPLLVVWEKAQKIRK